MTGKTARSQSAPGWAKVTAPLGLGLVVAAVLAYQAFDASREHRIAAARTVQDHADFAAYLLAALIDGRLNLAMQYAFYQEDRANAGAPARAAEPGVLRDANEFARCQAVVPAASRYFFRLELVGGNLIVDGPMPPEVRSGLVPALMEAVDADASPSAGQLFIPAGGTPTLLSYRVHRFEHLGRTFIYGLNSCFHDHDGNIFETAGRTPGLLPPTLVGAAPNDSLFTLTVVTAGGAVIHGPPLNDRGAGFTGSSALNRSVAPDSVHVMVTLLPNVAERLVIGGLPPSRLPVAVSLVLLAAVLMALAVLQIRRRQELIGLRERFVGNVSHELRTPLQQILLYVDLLRLGRVRSAAERDEALDVVHREARRVIALVENILHFSRAAVGPPPLRSLRVDLPELAEGLVESFRPLAEAKGVTITVNHDGACLAAAEPDAVRQVLLNLLDNAVKYGPDGQHVSVDVYERNGVACVSVADQGPGVPSEERANIWEAFYRLGREEAQAIAGSGIGLSIVTSLVRGMGGEADVDTREEGGARFTVSLPLWDTQRGGGS